MKTLNCILLGALAIAATAKAQTTATSDPVGFLTITIAGGSVASPKLSLISPTLLQTVSWQGAIATISGNTITVTGTPWTAGQFNGANGNFFVEAFSATKSGALSDISATTTNSITTVDNLSSFAAIGDTIRIRKHITIADFFGATNAAGLLASDDPTTADEIQIYNGANQTTYFYYTGSPGFPAGWYDSAFTLAPGVAGATVIGPNEGVVVKRKAAGNITFTFSGAVKTGNTLLPIDPGINVLQTLSAKGLTLGNSGLHNGNSVLTASDEPSTADEVTIYSISGQNVIQTNYFYYTGSPGFPAGWYDSAFQLAPGAGDAVTIPAGTSFVINRKSGGIINWALPSPSSF